MKTRRTAYCHARFGTVLYILGTRYSSTEEFNVQYGDYVVLYALVQVLGDSEYNICTRYWIVKTGVLLWERSRTEMHAVKIRPDAAQWQTEFHSLPFPPLSLTSSLIAGFHLPLKVL